MKNLTRLTLALVAAVAAGAAPAALTKSCTGSECTVLDDVAHQMWIFDWNLSGAKTWSNQIAWADNLDYGGHSDWELASAADFFGLLDGNGRSLSVFANFFANANGTYWTPDELTPGFKTTFNAQMGSTGGADPGRLFGGVAVRDATPVATVPEPAGWALASIALATAGAVTRRRRPTGVSEHQR